MEYSYVETNSTVDVIWNGPSEELCKKLVISGHTQKHHMKIYLFYPKMPTNHVSCLVNRFKHAWHTNVGIGKTGVSKALTAIDSVGKTDGIVSEDMDLVPILEHLELDDVAPDIDLIVIKLNKQLPSVVPF